MTQTEKHLAPAGTDGRGAEFAPAKKLNQYNRNRVANLCMIVRILPEGEPFLVGGRAAQTLTLLLEVGDNGFNSGEASPLRWARRTSAYVFVLRSLGIEITTVRECVGDASVARYRLKSEIEVIDVLEGGL